MNAKQELELQLKLSAMDRAERKRRNRMFSRVATIVTIYLVTFGSVSASVFLGLAVELRSFIAIPFLFGWAGVSIYLARQAHTTDEKLDRIIELLESDRKTPDED